VQHVPATISLIPTHVSTTVSPIRTHVSATVSPIPTDVSATVSTIPTDVSATVSTIPTHVPAAISPIRTGVAADSPTPSQVVILAQPESQYLPSSCLRARLQPCRNHRNAKRALAPEVAMLIVAPQPSRREGPPCNS
jgi:hypothetical protein